MYAGHVAIALGVRGVRRELPLWVLVLAAQACDWVELAIHPFTPRTVTDVYSHAYPFVVVQAIAAAALVWLWKRSTSAALTLLLVYLSHPLADYITGYKPLWLGGPSMGLHVITHPRTDFVVQGFVCLLGFAMYWQSLPATRRRRLSAAVPLGLLLALQGLSDLGLGWNKIRREWRTEASVAIGRSQRETAAQPHRLGRPEPMLLRRPRVRRRIDIRRELRMKPLASRA